MFRFDINVHYACRQKDNTNIQEGGRFKIFADSRGNTKLVIKDAQESDTGLYFCFAENKLGKIRCAASLRVVGKSFDMLEYAQSYW